MMNVISVPRIGFSSNCYVVIGESGDAIVIDPSAKADTVAETARSAGATIRGIFLTHGHFDHILHLDELRDLTQAEVYVHEDDADCLTDASQSLFSQIYHRETVFRPAEHLLQDGQTVTLGSIRVSVLHTPGHTPGSVLYLISDLMFSGDTLIKGCIGRTDFYRGDPMAMDRTLRKLVNISGEYTIYPGHEDTTSFRYELENNPFLLEYTDDRL